MTKQTVTASTKRHSRKLDGRVAIVTGAARGIGRGYALRLAQLGAAVVVVDRDLHAFEEFAEERALVTGRSVGDEVEALGAEALELEVDLTDSAATREMVAGTLERFKHIDVCVCNAGGGTGAVTENTAATIDPEQLAVVVERNLVTTVNTCTAVAAAMRERRTGKIVTVSSVGGLQPQRHGGYAHYASAKAAIIMYTRNLAQELGPFGVTANVIAPGSIGTGRLLPKLRAAGLESLTESIALRRLGTIEDCAAVLEFLATDLSDYVTGQVVAVDGGMRV